MLRIISNLRRDRWSLVLTMLAEHALGASDCLIGEIEQAVELAKVELAALERGQGRGAGHD